MSYLSSGEIQNIGFRSIGKNVLISSKASIYGASKINIGSNVRIDDFCIISAGNKVIEIGSYVHIACHSTLIGKESITIQDYSGVSSRVSIYSSSDTYSGDAMTNPTVPEEFTKVDHRPVHIGRHCIIGAGSVILPGVTMDDGVAVGALSLISRKCNTFKIYSGSPARIVGERSRNVLEQEKKLVEKLKIDY